MALDFDGVNDKVDYGDLAIVDGAAALSILLWMFRDTANGGDARDGLWSKNGAGNTGPYIELDFTTAGASLHEVGTSTYGTCPTGTWPASEWIHLAEVFNGGAVGNTGRLKVFKNGVEQTLTYNGTIGTTLPSTAVTIALGRNVNSGWFDGKIACYRLYNVALSQAEIAREMHSYLPVRRDGLITDSPLDDRTDALDYSGSGNPGTVTGCTQTDTIPPINYGPRVLRPRGFRSQLRRSPLLPPLPLRAWYGL